MNEKTLFSVIVCVIVLLIAIQLTSRPTPQVNEDCTYSITNGSCP